MVNLFMLKEAMASVALDNDSHMEMRREGFLSNPKLYRIIITIKNKKTDEVIWKGPLAHITRARERGILR